MTTTLNPAQLLCSNWVQRQRADYYQAVASCHPSETLVTALERYPLGPERATEARFAVDLGCKDGYDTAELLRRHWQVLAIDREPGAITRLHRRRDIDLTHLATRVQALESLTLPTGVDLINASFCLLFCSPAAFTDLWDKIVQSLRIGGRFCGHLSGDRDYWATDPNFNYVTPDRLERLLEPFDIEVFDEEEHLGRTALGRERYWHSYNIVARKRG